MIDPEHGQEDAARVTDQERNVSTGLE